ncbi:MAG: hypothetical protein QXK76_02050 [Candidatus Woesearchaeota archaeon]
MRYILKSFGYIFLVIMLLIFSGCSMQKIETNNHNNNYNSKNISLTEIPEYDNGQNRDEQSVNTNPVSKTKLKPLMDMTEKDYYKGEEGGLYGKGKNIPPDKFREAILLAESQIKPLDAKGSPSPEGKIGFIAIGMRNTEIEFNAFMNVENSDKDINPAIVFVNGAQDGKDIYLWATDGLAWAILSERVERSGLTNKQVQVAWIKIADEKPKGEFPKNARENQEYLKEIVLRLKKEYPNLKIAYLSSRIYGGYDLKNWNPEPYAYETAFSIRWLINTQINGDILLNYDYTKGLVRAPILVWGPYMWASSDEKRSDGLIWTKEDFEEDGTTPSKLGLSKTTKLLIDYFKFNEFAKEWYVKKN